ncbi:hypothetical protein [Burkholderia singularis]|nr:hypothetical protein [Burkholderia singularis]
MRRLIAHPLLLMHRGTERAAIVTSPIPRLAKTTCVTLPEVNRPARLGADGNRATPRGVCKDFNGM